MVSISRYTRISKKIQQYTPFFPSQPIQKELIEYVCSPTYIAKKLQYQNKTLATITDEEMDTLLTEIGYDMDI